MTDLKVYRVGLTETYSKAVYVAAASKEQVEMIIESLTEMGTDRLMRNSYVGNFDFDVLDETDGDPETADYGPWDIEGDDDETATA